MLRRVPRLGFASFVFARSCRSSPCRLFRSRGSGTPPPTSAAELNHRRPWQARRRDCAATGETPARTYTVRSSVDGRDHVPLRGYVIGPPWTHGPGPRCRVSADPRHVVHRTNRNAPGVSQVSSRVNTQSTMPVLQKSPRLFL